MQSRLTVWVCGGGGEQQVQSGSGHHVERASQRRTDTRGVLSGGGTGCGASFGSYRHCPVWQVSAIDALLGCRK